MTSVLRFLLPVLLAAFFAVIQPNSAACFDEPMMTIKTGNVTGVYYAAGSAVAKMHNRKRQEYGLRLITEASKGSIANIEHVLEGSATFGISQSNKLYQAQKGTDSWDGQPMITCERFLAFTRKIIPWLPPPMPISRHSPT